MKNVRSWVSDSSKAEYNVRINRSSLSHASTTLQAVPQIFYDAANFFTHPYQMPVFKMDRMFLRCRYVVM